MIWDDSQGLPGAYKTADIKKTAVNFLYNPSTVQASYQISNSQGQAALIYGYGSGGGTSSSSAVLRVPLQQQVQWTLYFDRTYELNTAIAAGADIDDVRALGVEVDIRQMKQFTGMFASVYSGNNNYYSSPTASSSSVAPVNVNSFNGTAFSIAQGIMQLSLCYVYFSGASVPSTTGGKQVGAGVPGTGLMYYGYIDSWDVQYTHFSQSMIPLRAVVDISFSLLPPPPIKPPSTAATSVSKGGIFPTPSGRPPTQIGVLP
jgi:hypothetical protein